MTTRDGARRAGSDLRPGGTRPGHHDREPATGGGPTAPSLPDRLAAARARKGVDLLRAERDTKIRVRYLQALERGDYRELPGAVYTKGFLRNYALYLGLDPDDVLDHWRRERGDHAVTEAVVLPTRIVLDAPRPLTFSPSVVVAALMTLGVIAFGLYLGVQLLRFAKAPPIEVTQPAVAVVETATDATTYRLVGTTAAGATVTIVAPGREQPYLVTALPDGTWSTDVELRRGKNTFEIGATDPETGKRSETTRTVVINVPYLIIQTPTLTVTQPVEGATYENGAIPIEGETTNATEVSVVAAYLGGIDGEPEPSPTPTVTPEPTMLPSPDPSASEPPDDDPIPVVLQIAEDGAFAAPLELTEGRWAITITATSAEGKTASLTRTVVVAYSGVTVVVTIDGGDAWLKVWTDGVLDERTPLGGRVYRDGSVVTFTGTTTVEVRTGSSGTTYFTVNGVPLGALGRRGIPETWLFAPPAPPQLTLRR